MRERESLPSLLLRPQLPPSSSSRLSAAQLSTKSGVLATETSTPPTLSSPNKPKREPRLRRALSSASLAGPSLSTVSSSSALGSFASQQLPLPSSSRSTSVSPNRERVEEPAGEEQPSPEEAEEEEAAEEGGADEALSSDVSSDFAALLSRTGAKSKTRPTPSLKARGKQREQQHHQPPIPALAAPQSLGSALERDSVRSDDSSSLRHISQYTATTAGGGAAEGEGDDELAADDEDEEGEVVARHEGLSGITASDSLRAFQKTFEHAGGGTVAGRRASGARALTAIEDLSSSKESMSPLPALYPPRRYFVLSSAGKLIYTTDPEEEATTLVGLMQAIVSIFADEGGDRIRYIDAGRTKIGFLLKAPLYLCCVSAWGEPESVLRLHLLHLHMLILSIVTLSQLNNIFARRANFDLRRMLEGTDPFFDRMLDRLKTGLGEMTASLEVYRLDAALREEAAKALQPCKIADTLYALIVSNGRMVNILKPKKHTIHPSDLHLLLCHLPSPPTQELDTADASWLPVCLPRFNPRGFLHVYVSWASEQTAVVLVCGDREAVGKAKEWCDGVKEKLRAVEAKKKQSGTLLERIERNKPAQEYLLGELSIPGLRHFLYKTKAHVQITYPAFEADYEQEEHRNRLVTLYQLAFDALHPKPAYSGSARPPAKLVYHRTEHEAVLGWTTTSFELYIAVSPLLPKSAVVSAARAVTRWVKKHESSLFLTKANEL